MGHSLGTGHIYSLNIHASYRCGHSGACCTSGWPIPVERDTCARLRAELREGRLGIDSATAALVGQADAPPETPVTAGMDEAGVCAFYERRPSRCAIHRQLGADALPVACRQFPRISLLDPRGLFVTLSHYCPTAASALFEPGELRVVESPVAFASDFGYDPLDARGALPPLLHPRVLLDLQTFDAWERAAVALLADAGRAPAEALAAVACLTEMLRAWRPGSDEPEQLVHRAAAVAREECEGRATPFAVSCASEHLRTVLRAIPESLRPSWLEADVEAWQQAGVDDTWNGWSAAVRRYLAAKVYGSWLAYQGRGLRTIVWSAAVALTLLRVHAAREVLARGQPELGRDALIEAIRKTDEMLLHLAGRQTLADHLSRIEEADRSDLSAALGCRLP